MRTTKQTKDKNVTRLLRELNKTMICDRCELEYHNVFVDISLSLKIRGDIEALAHIASNDIKKAIAKVLNIKYFTDIDARTFQIYHDEMRICLEVRREYIKEVLK